MLEVSCVHVCTMLWTSAANWFLISADRDNSPGRSSALYTHTGVSLYGLYYQCVLFA